MANQNPPLKNQTYTLPFCIRKNDGTIISNPTITAARVSKDGGASLAASGTVSKFDTTYGMCSLALTAAEMNADYITVEVTASDTGACPAFVTIDTYNNTQVGLLPSGYQMFVTGTVANVTTVATTTNLTNNQAKYMNGAVWVNTVSGAVGTVSYTNGIISNPSNSLPNAKTIADNLFLKKFWIQAGSSIALVGDMPNYMLDGGGWTLSSAVARDLSGATIRGCENLTGLYTALLQECYVYDSQIGASTWGEADFHTCHIVGTMTLNANAPFLFDRCIGVPITNPTINFNAVADSRSAIISNFGGSLTITNMRAGNTLHMDGNADLTLDATCTAGTVYISGGIRLTNNSTATVIDTSRWGEDQNIYSVTVPVAIASNQQVFVTGTVSATVTSPVSLLPNQDVIVVSGTVTNVTNDVGITQSSADKTWLSGTRTLTSFGTLVADVWNNVVRTLTSGGGGGGATASEVWSYFPRTLTQTAPQVIQNLTDNSQINVYKNTTFSFVLNNLPDFTGWQKMWFTVKEYNNLEVADSESIIQIQTSLVSGSGDGLLFINKQVGSPADGYIQVLSTTSVQVQVKATVTDGIPAKKMFYGLKYINALGDTIAVADGGEFVVHHSTSKKVA